MVLNLQRWYTILQVFFVSLFILLGFSPYIVYGAPADVWRPVFDTPYWLQFLFVAFGIHALPSLPKTFFQHPLRHLVAYRCLRKDWRRSTGICDQRIPPHTVTVFMFTAKHRKKNYYGSLLQVVYRQETLLIRSTLTQSLLLRSLFLTRFIEGPLTNFFYLSQSLKKSSLCSHQFLLKNNNSSLA